MTSSKPSNHPKSLSPNTITFAVRELTNEWGGGIIVHCNFQKNVMSNISQTLKIADPCLKGAPVFQRRQVGGWGDELGVWDRNL